MRSSGVLDEREAAALDRVVHCLLRNLPFLTAHLVERIGYPLHDMERVHDPPRVRAAASGQRLYPPRTVGGDDLDGAPLLSGELVEKQVQHVLAVPLVGVKSEFVCKFANAPRLLFCLHEPALIARDGGERGHPLLELLDRRAIIGLPPRPLPAL